MQTTAKRARKESGSGRRRKVERRTKYTCGKSYVRVVHYSTVVICVPVPVINTVHNSCECMYTVVRKILN